MLRIKLCLQHVYGVKHYFYSKLKKIVQLNKFKFQNKAFYDHDFLWSNLAYICGSDGVQLMLTNVLFHSIYSICTYFELHL